MSPTIQQQQRIKFLQPNEHIPNLVPQNRLLNLNQIEDDFNQFSPKPYNQELNLSNQSNNTNPKSYQPNKQFKNNNDSLNTPKLIRLKDLPPSPYDPV